MKRNEDVPKRDIADIDEVIVHHSANYFSPEQIDSIHQDQDLPGCKFQYLIYNGEITKMWPISRITPHVEDWDLAVRTVGVCVVGDYDKRKVPYDDEKALKRLLVSLYHVLGEFTLSGHMEYEQGKCPGVHLMKVVEEVRG